MLIAYAVHRDVAFLEEAPRPDQSREDKLGRVALGCRMDCASGPDAVQSGRQDVGGTEYQRWRY